MITAIKDHFYAIRQALILIVHGNFLLFFIPGIVISLIFLYYLTVVKTVEGYKDTFSLIPWVGGYLEQGTSILFSWIEGISVFIYQFIIITALSPFHTVLSQRVEEQLQQKKFSTGWEKMLNDIVRTLGIVVLGGLLYLFAKMIWLLLAYLVGLQFLTPYISLILVGFFTGFNSYDFSLERYDISVDKSWKFAFKHGWHMILTGLIFTGFLQIPFIGVVLAPVILTIIGTICYLRINERKAPHENNNLAT